MVKTKVSMTIDTEVYNNFKKFCKENGMKMSTKVEQLMIDTLKNFSLQRFIKK